jgi:hypothetical protein
VAAGVAPRLGTGLAVGDEVGPLTDGVATGLWFVVVVGVPAPCAVPGLAAGLSVSTPVLCLPPPVARPWTSGQDWRAA